MKTQKEKLMSLVNTQVALVNTASAEMDDSRVQIRVHGILEVVSEPDGEQEFYVRVAEGYSGSSGICFRAKHVEEIDKKTFHYEIVLR